MHPPCWQNYGLQLVTVGPILLVGFGVRWVSKCYVDGKISFPANSSTIEKMHFKRTVNYYAVRKILKIC